MKTAADLAQEEEVCSLIKSLFLFIHLPRFLIFIVESRCEESKESDYFIKQVTVFK